MLEGADAVRQTCRDTMESLEGTTTTYERCVIAAGVGAVAVDTFARYTRPDGMTAVASCDIYEFAEDQITAITSYAVEIDPRMPERRRRRRCTTAARTTPPPPTNRPGEVKSTNHLMVKPTPSISTACDPHSCSASAAAPTASPSSKNTGPTCGRRSLREAMALD